MTDSDAVLLLDPSGPICRFAHQPGLVTAPRPPCAPRHPPTGPLADEPTCSGPAARFARADDLTVLAAPGALSRPSVVATGPARLATSAWPDIVQTVVRAPGIRTAALAAAAGLLFAITVLAAIAVLVPTGIVPTVPAALLGLGLLCLDLSGVAIVVASCVR